MPENKPHDVFISYSHFDRTVVTQVVETLRTQGLNYFLDEHDIPLGSYIADTIGKGLHSSKGAVFFFSPHSLNSAWVKAEVELALNLLMQKEIQFLIPVLLGTVDLKQINRMLTPHNALDYSKKEVETTNILEELSEQLVEGIRKHLPRSGKDLVDLAFVILAMTRDEARALLMDKIKPFKPEKFDKLRAELTKSYSISRLICFYGNTRDDWRSPLCQVGSGRPVTIKEFIVDLVEQLNKSARESHSGQIINPHFRSEDFMDADLAKRTKAHEELEDRCVLVVDSLSLFHPEVADIFTQSPLPQSSKPIIPIAVPPPYYRRAELDKLIEDAMRAMMTMSYYRFETGLDKLCEFGINHPRGLKRWLYATLPDAAEKFSRASPTDENRDNFRRGRW